VLSRDDDSARDAVVVLKEPYLDGDRLTFDVRVLEGDLAGTNGSASVLVDIIGLPFTPLFFAGVARRAAVLLPPPYGYLPPYYPYPCPPPYCAVVRP
jgi:hypothetical protein